MRWIVPCFALFHFIPALLANTSNSLMDVSPDGKRLLVANTDNGTVTLVDAERMTPVREIKVGKKPEGVTWIGGGPLALVTLYGESAVAFVDVETGKVGRTGHQGGAVWRGCQQGRDKGVGDA